MYKGGVGRWANIVKKIRLPKHSKWKDECLKRQGSGGDQNDKQTRG